jgi:hypothetical protein
MLDEIFTRALAAFPNSADTIGRIRQVRREAQSRPYEEFFEPKTAFDLSGRSPRLIGLSLPDAEAWAKHMAYSTRVRMLSLEPAILDAIVNDHLTPAVVLLRSHSETAGLACLALMTLRGAALDRLREVIQRTLFGSALAKGWKSFKDLAEFVPQTESQPASAGDLMKALDSFVAAGSEGNGRYQAAYGILCEFAHPNNRGMLGFMRSVDFPPVGWRIRYSPTEEVRSDDREMVLGLLLEMMRLGYSASEFLRLGIVHAVSDGFSITPPKPELMKRVLKKLMLLEDAPDEGWVL